VSGKGRIRKLAYKLANIWIGKLDNAFADIDAFAWVQRWSVSGDPYHRRYRDLRFDRRKEARPAVDDLSDSAQVLMEASDRLCPDDDTPLVVSLDRLFLRLGPPPDTARRVKSVPAQGDGGVSE